MALETFAIVVPVSADIADDAEALAFLVEHVWTHELHEQGGMRAIGPLHLCVLDEDYEGSGFALFRINGPAYSPNPPHNTYGIRPHAPKTEAELQRERAIAGYFSPFGPRRF